MLKIDNLSVQFRRYQGLFRQSLHPQLSDLNFEIKAGEVLALIGHSGAGKSLLAQAILGLLPKNARVDGQIYFENQPLYPLYPTDLRGAKLAFMPQEITHLDPQASIGKQILWAIRRAGGHTPPHIVLAKLNLNPQIANLYPHQISSGMARRVLFALATASQPKLLIVDEPTRGLDAENRDIILEQLHRRSQQGTAIVLLSHDLEASLPIADRVLLLKAGQAIGIETAQDFQGLGTNLRAPYARALWHALPKNGFKTDA